MEPITKKPCAAMQALMAELRVKAGNGEADAMFYLAGFLANDAVAMQDATMLDEAERWFLAAAAKNQPVARGFVDEAWPVAKEFFRDKIAPGAA